VVDVVVGRVELVLGEAVLVVELLLDEVVVEVEVVDEGEVGLVTLVDVDEVVVVVGSAGGVMVRLKLPDPLRNPSTKMK
jgi:hypothetical protein